MNNETGFDVQEEITALAKESFNDNGKNPQGAENIQESINSLTPESSDIEIQEILKTVAEQASESQKEKYLKSLSNKLNIGIRSLKKDMQRYEKNTTEDGEEFVLSAHFHGLIDIAINEDGEIVYLINTLSGINEVETWEHDGITYAPPAKEAIPFQLPKAEAVKRWYTEDDDEQLFNDLMSYLVRFSYLPSDLWVMIAFSVFLTYLQDHPDIHYLPEILFYAVPERGKSRTGKAVTYVSFRGIHVVEIRESNLFRYSQDMKATIFFDIKDVWKKAEKSNAEDILLMRYEKGAKVARVLYPEKGKFLDMVHYDVFGATIIATNEPCHKILDTRCIPITMPNKPGLYENVTPEKAQELKERLTAWRARTFMKALPVVNPVDGLTGRLWDISKPLFQMCKLVAQGQLNELTGAIIEVSGQKIEDKRGSIEGQIVKHLYELSQEALESENVLEWKIPLSGDNSLLTAVNAERPDKYRLSPQSLGLKLKAIGIQTKATTGHKQIILKRADFDTLLLQYGLKENNIVPAPEKSLPLSTTLFSDEKTASYHSREFVESKTSADNPLLTKPIENKEEMLIVDSSRESTEGSEGLNLNCPKGHATRSDCNEYYDMKIRPGVQGLQRFCPKSQKFCEVSQ